MLYVVSAPAPAVKQAFLSDLSGIPGNLRIQSQRMILLSPWSGRRAVSVLHLVHENLITNVNRLNAFMWATCDTGLRSLSSNELWVCS